MSEGRKSAATSEDQPGREDPVDTAEGVDTVNPGGRVSRRIGWLLVVALLAVPMAVIPGDRLTVVSLWGFLNTAGPASGAGGYPVWAFFLEQPRPFGALPASIRAWPLAIGFHLLAAASATVGVALGREDRRVTGGLLALATAASLWVSVGVATRFGVGTTSGWLTVLPVGALATLAVVVAVYGRDLREIAEA